MPLRMTEAAQRAVRGTNPLQHWFFALSSKSPSRALVFGAHIGREAAAREARGAGGMVKGGLVHDGLAYVDKDEIDELLNRIRAARPPQGHMPNAGRRRGRIVRRVDPLQEKLGIELLRGELITLDGTVYLVGGFLDGGDKVELWRESLAHAPNAGFEDRPMAARGLTSYRYRGRYGWIMIGAKDDRDALREAKRSTDDPITRERLEVWNESADRYEPVSAPRLRRNASDEPVPIANPDEYEDDKRLYLFTFGAYAWTKVYVWADSDEDAFEIAVEWIDDNAPGHLTDVTEDDLKRAAEDEGIEWQPTWPDWDDMAFARVVQAAEADLTMVAHTTLKHGQYLHSWEWTFDEVTDPAEYERVAEESAAEQE